MFGRSKTSPEVTSVGTDAPAREGAKNRPTPKRRDQEAARKQPLVVTDRKAAKAKDRAKRQEAYAKQREAMTTGDERYLPPRDKGPIRRYIRDYVDSRWNLGEFMLPVMILVLALSFVRQTWAMTIVFAAVYGVIILAVGDAIVTWRRVKKQLVAKFGADAVASERGLALYTIMRAFQMRRTRMPKPQVSRGQRPS